MGTRTSCNCQHFSTISLKWNQPSRASPHRHKSARAVRSQCTMKLKANTTVLAQMFLLKVMNIQANVFTLSDLPQCISGGIILISNVCPVFQSEGCSSSCKQVDYQFWPMSSFSIFPGFLSRAIAKHDKQRRHHYSRGICMGASSLGRSLLSFNVNIYG